MENQREIVRSLMCGISHFLIDAKFRRSQTLFDKIEDQVALCFQKKGLTKYAVADLVSRSIPGRITSQYPSSRGRAIPLAGPCFTSTPPAAPSISREPYPLPQSPDLSSQSPQLALAKPAREIAKPRSLHTRAVPPRLLRHTSEELLEL